MKFMTITAVVFAAFVAIAHGRGPGVGCGALSQVGEGCAGSGGVSPSLQFTGCARAGEILSFELTGGLGGSTALLLVGATPADVALPNGCTLLVQPIPSVFTLPLGGEEAGEGANGLAFLLPDDLEPTTVYMQAAILDAEAAGGFSMSNAAVAAIQ